MVCYSISSHVLHTLPAVQWQCLLKVAEVAQCPRIRIRQTPHSIPFPEESFYNSLGYFQMYVITRLYI
jgi:hypothetical protein